jgi:hypothetical protein
LFLHIGQGAGLSGASGVRPFLPVLLAGLLASGHSGINFDRTPFSFIEQPAFLVAVFAFAICSYALGRWLSRRQGSGSGQSRAQRIANSTATRGSQAVSIGLGALLFCAAITTDSSVAWPGLLAGAACAALGYAAMKMLFTRVRGRLDSSAQSLLPAYADGIALVVAAAAVFLPPTSFVVLAVFAFVLLRARGRQSQKYGGLRILR